MSFKTLLYDYKQVFYENQRFYHFKNPEMPNRYFANYIDYKRLPNLEEIREDLSYLKKEQEAYKSDYAMLFFPENRELPKALKADLEAAGFSFKKHLIFTCRIQKLKLRQTFPDSIKIEKLTASQLDAYMAYKYRDHLIYGQAFAEEMSHFNEKHLPEPGSTIYLAFDGNQIIGDLTAWDHGQYVEMDDFSVLENYRGQGIGSALQKVASDGYLSAILIAEEINRDLYQHQGYQQVSYYWTALRSLDRE